MKIQLALDLLDEQHALHVVRQAGRFCDIIEVGTSLLKLSGIGIVNKIRAICPGQEVFVDMKIIDGPEREATLMRACRPDYYSMLACATDKAVAKVLAVARTTSSTVVFDLQSLDDPVARCHRLVELGATHVCIHKNSDCGEDLMAGLSEFLPIRSKTPLSVFVAGGLGLESLQALHEILQPSGIIIGGAILNATDVAEAARQFKQQVDLIGKDNHG